VTLYYYKLEEISLFPYNRKINTFVVKTHVIVDCVTCLKATVVSLDESEYSNHTDEQTRQRKMNSNSHSFKKSHWRLFGFFSS